MRSRTVRLLALAAMAAALASCNSADRRFGPDDQDALLAALGGSNAPSNLTAGLAANNQVNLTWRDNSPNETGFELHRSTDGPSGTFTLLTRTTANATSYSDAGLAGETQYCYKVRAFKTNGKNTDYSTFSSTSCATTPPRPASTTDAAPAGSHAIDVHWTDNSGAEDGYRIERKVSTGVVWETAGTVLANGTSFRDAGRSSDVEACYRVVAFNALGSSDPSNIDCTTPPAAPTGLEATSSLDRTIDLKWLDNSGVEGGYQVQRSAADGPLSAVATLPPNATTYRDGGLEGDTRYTYVVRATKDGGFSDLSNAASALSVVTPPSAPSGATARPNGSTSVIVEWTYTLANADGFRVERSLDNANSWTMAGTADRGARGFVDDGRSSEQQVWYRVFAFNTKGTSDPSNIASTTPPAAPTELVATGADGAIDLTWHNNSSSMDAYEVQRYVCYPYYYYYYQYCEYQTIATVDRSATTYRDSPLSPSESHQYRVIGRKDGGYSDPSNEVFATTSAASPD
jgi:fibronectin type 3 domain-containing protein